MLYHAHCLSKRKSCIIFTKVLIRLLAERRLNASEYGQVNREKLHI